MNKARNIVVVLNYNDWEETTRFCKAVEIFNTVNNILVIDNSSTDDSQEKLKQLESGKITILNASQNKGYAAGNNVGLKFILDKGWQGNIIVSNPDIYFSELNLQNILSALDDPNIGLATGLITTDGIVTSNYGWKLPSFWELVSNQFLLLYKIKRLLGISMYLPYPKNEERIYCDCVSGCFFCLTTDTLKQVGLLDERTFLLGEENILGFRIKQAGKKVCVVSTERVEHKQHHSLKKVMKKNNNSQRWLYDSLMVYVVNYLKKGKLSQKIFSILFSVATYETRIIVRVLSKMNKYNGL